VSVVIAAAGEVPGMDLGGIIGGGSSGVWMQVGEEEERVMWVLLGSVSVLTFVGGSDS